MRKRKLLWLALLLPIAGGWYWWRGAAPIPQAETIRIVTADRGNVRQIVTATGHISANNEVDIKCKASGVVLTLPYEVSDLVKKGSLVVELDPIDEQRNVEKAQTALSSAKARLLNAQRTLDIAEETLKTDRKQAEISYESAMINARDARSKSNRMKMLMDNKQVSVEQAESAETAALRAEQDVETAKNAIEALKTKPMTIDMDRNEVGLAEKAVESAATDLLDAQQRLIETKVMAPMDGVVTTRPAQIGTIAASGITNTGGGTSIMTLADLSRLFVLVPVDEADIGRVKLEQKVVIKCDAFRDNKFEGKILRMAPKGLTQNGVVSFEVKIEVLGEGKNLLRPEMTADIEIVIAEREKVIRLPSEAVLTREKDRQRYVLVPAEETATRPAVATTSVAPATTTAPATAATAPAEAAKPRWTQRTVEVGVDDGAFCEIVSGLKEGDKVVIQNDAQGQWSKQNDDDFMY